MSVRAGEAIRVLVAEDQQVYRSIYAIFFTKAKIYVPIYVANGQEGLNFISESGEPACIFLDLDMPVMDGEQFLRALPAKMPQRVPIFIVSTSTEEERAKKLLSMGARAYLPKPFRFEDLKALIEKYVPRV